MDIIGLVFVLVFYLAIFVCGIWIARRKKVLSPNSWQELVVGSHDLGLVVGIFTLVATEVGGAFVNGTAEEVYKSGFLWCLAPVGYALSMSINGLFFTHKLRDSGCVTLIDKLQDAYGPTVGGLVYLPSCIGDICWTAAVLSALGSTLSIILDVDQSLTVTVSAAIAICYTLAGGLYSVAYTDVIQLLFIFGGLWLAIPFMFVSDLTHVEKVPFTEWTGQISTWNCVTYLDTFILIVCGGIPWQPYYQRALAVNSNFNAKLLSFGATVLCLVCMIPPILVGGLAKSVDWNVSTFDQVPQAPTLVLPASMAYLLPYWVSVIGLAAISAAAMSSVDSSLLSGASYLTHNVYVCLIRLVRSEASKTETILAFRSIVLILGVLSTLMSLTTSTIYGLWILAGDLGYVIVFPQFLAAVHWPEKVNVFGSVCASLVAITIRLLIGEPMIGLTSVIPLPEHPDGSPVLPVKTILMLMSLTTLFCTSYLRTISTKKPRLNIR